MKLPDEEYVTVAWLHVCCYRCWFSDPANVIMDRRGERITGAYVPKYEDRIKGSRIYTCCVCAKPSVGGAKFLDHPDALRCDHLPNGELRIIPTTNRKRKGPILYGCLD